MRLRIFALLLTLLSAEPALAEALAIDVNSRPIETFRIGSSETKFGAFTFVGGLEMTSYDRNFGSLSGWRFRDAGSDVLSVSDNGFWLSGWLERDASGIPLGFGRVLIAEMTNGAGEANSEKWNSDAESLLTDGDQVTVGFERRHRISTGTLDPATLIFSSKDEPLPVPTRELRSNRGFEAIAKSPATSPLAGARIVVTEKSLDSRGNLFAGILDGPQKGQFSVVRDGAFDVSDGDFLPNGDLLLLERRFSMAQGVAMRIRRIKGSDIVKGAVVDGETVLEADMAYQIDNMECLDVWERGDGATMVSLASDDNHSILQRNLYLEFEFQE
ncbi:MAG: esterase-like activity of phytase family protein [Rhizobiaceae bacterium]